MTNLTSLMEMTAGEWRQALELPESDIPDVVITEGSWWREQRTQWRLSYLSDVRELNFPDIFWGRRQDKKVVYCCAYGAARTVEIIHLFGILGTKLAVQIGTCGGLQSHLKPGDIILPKVALCREGVAHIYGAIDSVAGSAEWINRAQQLLLARGHQTYTGTHLTWSTLFGQTGKMVETWHQAGYLSVDMETATTFAAAEHFRMPAVSMLVVWDDLTRNRSFLDPLSEAELAALNKSNESVFEIALELAKELSLRN
jgi:purine-nucleoside phosphorylase